MSSYLDWQPTGWRYMHPRHGTWHVNTYCARVTVTYAPPIVVGTDDVRWLGSNGSLSNSVHAFASLARAMLAVERHVAELGARSGEQLEACREVAR